MALKPLRLNLAPSQATGREVAKLLWRAVAPFRARTGLAVALLVIAKLASVAVPLVLKRIIDSFSRPEDILVLPVFLLLAYALLRFSGTLFGELRDVIFSRVAHTVVAEFSGRAFAHLLQLTPRFHTVRQTGRLIREVERGTGGVGFLLGVGVFTIVPTLVEIFAVLGVMVLNYSDWFSAIIVATFIVYTTFTVLFTNRREVHQRRVNDLDSHANSRLVDGLLNYETIKASANESFEETRFRSIMGTSIDAGVRNQKALSMLHIGQSAIIAAGVTAVMLLAGQSVVQGTMSVGDLVLVNAYVIQICLPLNALGFVFRQASDALVNAEKLLGLLNQRSDIGDGPKDLEVSQAEVRFEHVGFGYESGRRILWDVDFAIPGGTTVAVVGGSGSGKSTLGRLLMRFYDVEEGAVRVDGQNVRDVSQKSLRDAIGIVPQDTMLFNDTIEYNIAYGRPGATLAEVIEAAKAAQLHELIASLPEQYATVVGERGLKLSGGEKQRIAIARVVLRNPRILIFDEATSALDARAERAIQEELERIAQNRTTLVIAHRMSTIVNAHEILVLEHGRVVERGTHQALIDQRGLYAQMWALQQQERELASQERRLALQPVSLASLAASVIDSLRPEIDAKNIRLYNVLGAEPVRVTGDPAVLQQVLWDLCANAVEVTPEGGRVEIEVLRAGPNARVKVSDTGSPDAARRLRAVQAGNGPGEARPAMDLARIRALVDQHAGSLAIDRLPRGSGTSYVLEFPLRAVATLEQPVPVPALPGRAPDTPAVIDARALEGASILVVDDQQDARDLLSAVLMRQGARVQALGEGAEAIRWFEEHPASAWPDLLVCDIALADTDGYRVVRQVRAMEARQAVPVTERMPAIALTGFAGPEDRTRALLAGFQLHLGKPVEPAELLAAAASLIGTERAGHTRARAFLPPSE